MNGGEKMISDRLKAVAILKKLKADCTQEEREIFLRFAEISRANSSVDITDDRFSDETLQLLKDLNCNHKQTKNEIEGLQVQHQLMPCLGLAFIALCFFVGIIAVKWEF